MPRPHGRLLETPGHSQTSLAQPLVGSLLLSPGSWCIQSFVCALQESVSPVLYKFSNQVPLDFRIKFPGCSKSLCWIPRLRNLFLVLELLWQCENFFGFIVFLFVGHLLGGSMVGLITTSSKSFRVEKLQESKGFRIENFSVYYSNTIGWRRGKNNRKLKEMKWNNDGREKNLVNRKEKTKRKAQSIYVDTKPLFLAFRNTNI